jgi:hypothetical protein
VFRDLDLVGAEVRNLIDLFVDFHRPEGWSGLDFGPVDRTNHGVRLKTRGFERLSVKEKQGVEDSY